MGRSLEIKLKTGKPLFYIKSERAVYEECSWNLYVDERKLKSKGWPEGKTWVSGLRKNEFKKIGLEVFDTCNCNGTWHYLVDEAKAKKILEQGID